MAKFTKRLTAPSKTDKNFINYNKGGYSTCITIDKNTGYTLPNCVGYAHGRLLEILGKKAINWKLPACNAEDWYDKAKENGLKVGKTPKLGAVVCWRAGKTHNGADGAGHVAVVEEIKSNGDILTSNSAYGGTNFYTKVITKANGYNYSNTMPLVGFIYCGLEFDNKPTVVEETKVTTNLKKGDVIQLKSGCKYYNGKAIPSWIFKSTLYYRGMNNNGIKFSTLKTGAVTGIVSPENVLNYKGTTTTTKTTFKKGDKVKIKKGAKTYNGVQLASFVYGRTNIIKSVSGDKAVVTYSGVVVATVNTKDLEKV